ncbi:MAG: hypothetical protein LUG16_03845, partial [Candidatus Gastranaerophilales bacterium]|nr:hypothetical protein [Candidatus Gastranaerophilales bacterium]
FQSEFKNKDFENQITKIREIYDSQNIINTWIEKVGYINKSIENVYARLGENIDFDDVSEKVDIIYENISALNIWTAKIDNIDSSAKEMEDKLSYLVQADNSEKISDIKDKVNSINDAVSEEKIDDIKNKIDSISKSVSEDKVDYIKNKVDSISKSVSEDKVDYIKNKVENIHNSVSEERISNIQDKISELGKYLEETKNISNILYDVKNRLDSSLSEEFDFDDLANKMDIVYENLSAINEWASKIDSIQDKISQLNLVFENGSIESKIDVIYENIAGLNQWANKLDSISKQSEDLDSKYTLTSNNLNIKIDELSQTLENANQIISDIPDIKEKLSELSGELHAITSQTKTDTDSYIYTLLDIESDFLKMHKYMEDNTKITSGDINALKERFSELNDDISSISIRTNKLILSADDANKEFKECLQEFKSALMQLDEQKNAFNPELKYELVAEKISGLTSLLQNIVITNKNLNSAFVYTAEWIDAAGSTLNSVQNDLVLIKKEIDTVNKNAAENIKDIKALIQADLEKEEFNPEEITNSINNEITAITDKIDALQNVFTELKIDDKICAITDRINEIENVFTELKLDDKICALTDRIDELENAFVSLKTDDISELKSVITGVIVQLNTALKPDIDSLNEKIEKLTENNNNKFTELETLLQEKVDFQGKKIENLENKINEMSSKFDKLVEVMGEDQKAFEIKDVLNYIASQIAGVNEKINEQQRHGNELINEMSQKLNGFNDDINKIVSYIEEE